MQKGEETIRDIVRGLEGLITLNEWERTLIQDLRDKAETVVRLGVPGEPRPPENRGDSP